MMKLTDETLKVEQVSVCQHCCVGLSPPLLRQSPDVGRYILRYIGGIAVVPQVRSLPVVVFTRVAITIFPGGGGGGGANAFLQGDDPPENKNTTALQTQQVGNVKQGFTTMSASESFELRGMAPIFRWVIITSRDEPQPKLSPAIMMGYLVFIEPSSTAHTRYS